MTSGRLAILGLVIAVPLVVTGAQGPAVFEVASVKPGSAGPPPPPSGPIPGRFYRPGSTVGGLIQDAYGVGASRIFNLPEWARRDRWEVLAQAPRGRAGDVPAMLQSLLAERFHLALHIEERRLPHAALVRVRTRAQPGPGLVPCLDDPNRPVAAAPIRVPPGGTPFLGVCQPMSSVARNVETRLRMPVIDQTGLEGRWSYTLFYRDDTAGPARGGSDDLPSFTTGLDEQLGLRVQSRYGPIPVMVVDRVEPPSGN